MTEIKEILFSQCASHPAMQIQDAVKLLYQSEFGPGHLIANPQQALFRLCAELDATPADGSVPLVEPIGGGMARLNLGALRRTGLSANTLCSLFIQSAKHTQGSLEGFLGKLDVLRELIAAGQMGSMTTEALNRYLEQYAAAGYPAVSHSEAYRAAYKPAYRVLRQEYTQYLRLFEAVDSRPEGPVTLAIDGRCASGKSTLGRLLSEVYGATLFHMDDFFLPFERKTPERLAQPGGNVDYERFAEEVLQPLKACKPFSYRPYSCARGALSEPLTVQPARIRVVEGSYAQHPAFGNAYDLRVFLTCPREVQRERILRRNGPAMLEKFDRMWIPLEEAYFSAFPIEAQSDLVFDT